MHNINLYVQLTGQKLKYYIKEKGYTQEQFALEIMFVDPSTLRRWIANGITKIELLFELAIALDIKPEELFN